MKTTIELPDELLIAVKKHAAEHRTTIRALVESGLRGELQKPRRKSKKRPAIKWVTVPGGLPPGLDISDRTKMMDFIMADRPGHDRTRQ